MLFLKDVVLSDGIIKEERKIVEGRDSNSDETGSSLSSIKNLSNFVFMFV